jgi:hypothetical protein
MYLRTHFIQTKVDHMNFVAFTYDTRLPDDTIILDYIHHDPDIAFISFIIHCFETRTNIKPTVFIRFIPKEYDTNITEVIHNIANALVDIPFIIPGHIQHIQNTIQPFQVDVIKKSTQKPTIFGLNLLALLKITPVDKLRRILHFFTQQNNDSQALGFFWNQITSIH